LVGVNLPHPQGNFALLGELAGIAQQIEQVRGERIQILLRFNN